MNKLINRKTLDYNFFDYSFYKEKNIDYNHFANWLKMNDYDVDEENLKRDWKYIENRIVAEIANKIFNRNLYYKTIILDDSIIKEALKYFEDARLLLLN